VADAAAARDQAREILGQDRFQDSDLPRPLEKPLDWLDERVHDVGDWLSGVFDDVDAGLPGGEAVVWILLIGCVGLVTFALARSVVKRRAIAAYGRPRVGEDGVEIDPASLERAADAAERDGDYEQAVRLRFRAGVLRLERQEALEPTVLRTTGEIGAALRSAPFDALGKDLDEIAYGGRPAAAQDADAAREGWAAVLEERR
jgi:hypothetical protein